MKQIALSKRIPVGLPALLTLLICSLFATVYYWSLIAPPPTGKALTSQLESKINAPATVSIYQEATRLAAKTLASELGIELKNYDLSEGEYQALVDAAAEKFGHCEQYRLYPISGGVYPCYSCQSKPHVELLAGQTYRIGQTCGAQKTRYSQGLPEPGLFYLIEYRGNIFDVLVAEHVKLQLFRFSRERQQMIERNGLAPSELLLPPANKILR